MSATYKKELTLTGTMIRNEYFGFPWSVYFVISKRDMLQYIPQDIYGIMSKSNGIFMVINAETRDEIILNFGEEFEQEAVVTISQVNLMFNTYTLINSIEILSFEKLL